jgi:hypothetical protein
MRISSLHPTYPYIVYNDLPSCDRKSRHTDGRRLKRRVAQDRAIRAVPGRHGSQLASGQNPDNLAVDALAAELTNHLIPDAVVTPGVVPTMVNLARAGFIYTR